MNTSTPNQPKQPSPLKILLIGQPGCRKTTLALQFPDVHVIDCDRNLDGATKYLRENKHKDLTYTWDDIRVDDSGVMLDISECFDRVCDKLKLFQTTEEYKKRKTVVLDSLSHVNEFIVRKVLKMKNKPSMDISLWQDFATAAYTILVARLDQTNKTVIAICHEDRVYEADPQNIMKKKVVEINPLFSGKVGNNLGAFFTDVWQMELRPASAGKIECWIKTQRTPQCAFLKNTLGMPPEINVTDGIKAIEQYAKGRI